MNPASSEEQLYWVAMKSAADELPNVFGPYTLSAANATREKWVRDYPSAMKISAVYWAAGRELANRNAPL